MDALAKSSGTWFQIQETTYLPAGRYSVDHYIIDFYCPELKLAIELDGEVHDSPEQKEYDKVRQDYLEAFGITFIRIKNEEFLGNPNKAFGRIEEEIKRLSAISSRNPE
ncbi:MAG: endonuclease domain-containing protein [Ignavibacterium sp.]